MKNYHLMTRVWQNFDMNLKRLLWNGFGKSWHKPDSRTHIRFQSLYLIIVTKKELKIWKHFSILFESLSFKHKKFSNNKTTCSWSFNNSHFLCKNLSGACADYLIIFLDLLTFFFATFFSKAGFKRSLNTRKPFKNNFIKWKTK